jgi:hypothetical protein
VVYLCVLLAFLVVGGVLVLAFSMRPRVVRVRASLVRVFSLSIDIERGSDRRE